MDRNWIRFEVSQDDHKLSIPDGRRDLVGEHMRDAHAGKRRLVEKVLGFTQIGRLETLR